MDTTGQGTTTDQGRFLDELYEAFTRHGGPPLSFQMFDVQLCGSLTAEWLNGVLETETIKQEEVRWMIEEGFLRRRTNAKGESGYIIYTPHQARTLKTLKDSGRYDLEELRHFMSDWDDYIEAIVMQEPAYDDEGASEYDSLVRRVREMVALFKVDEDQQQPRLIPTDQWVRQKAESRAKAKQWRSLLNLILQITGEELAPCHHRLLFRLRWWDEHVRIIMADQFEAALLQGYSPEVSFGHTQWRSDGPVVLSDIDWKVTLGMYRQSRKEGLRFPLRTPAFNVTERGVEFLTTPTPEEYKELHAHYRLNQLASSLSEMGKELWSSGELPLGDAVCPGCQGRFLRSSPKRLYCGEVCRSREKSRRWRERDPERARLTQSRYWKTYEEG